MSRQVLGRQSDWQHAFHNRIVIGEKHCSGIVWDRCWNVTMCLGVKSCERVCVVRAPVCTHISDFVFVNVSSLSPLWRLCQVLLLGRSVTFSALCPDMFASINVKYSQTPVMSGASQCGGQRQCGSSDYYIIGPVFLIKSHVLKPNIFGNDLMILRKLRTVLSQDTEQVIYYY